MNTDAELLARLALAMKDSTFRARLEAMLPERPPLARPSYQSHVTLAFIAEDIAPGETRKVVATNNFGDAKLFKLRKVWMKEDGVKWWLHDIQTDACKHRRDDQKYWCSVHGTDYGSAYRSGLCSQFPSTKKGFKFESTPPLYDGFTMGVCDPRSIVLVIENQSDKTATFKAALLGVKGRDPEVTP